MCFVGAALRVETTSSLSVHSLKEFGVVIMWYLQPIQKLANNDKTNYFFLVGKRRKTLEGNCKTIRHIKHLNSQNCFRKICTKLLFGVVFFMFLHENILVLLRA